MKIVQMSAKNAARWEYTTIYVNREHVVAFKPDKAYGLKHTRVFFTNDEKGIIIRGTVEEISALLA